MSASTMGPAPPHAVPGEGTPSDLPPSAPSTPPPFIPQPPGGPAPASPAERRAEGRLRAVEVLAGVAAVLLSAASVVTSVVAWRSDVRAVEQQQASDRLEERQLCVEVEAYAEGDYVTMTAFLSDPDALMDPAEVATFVTDARRALGRCAPSADRVEKQAFERALNDLSNSLSADRLAQTLSVLAVAREVKARLAFDAASVLLPYGIDTDEVGRTSTPVRHGDSPLGHVPVSS